MDSFAQVLEREIAAQQVSHPTSARSPFLRSLDDLVASVRCYPVPSREEQHKALKARFRAQARAAHPDRGGSAAEFRAVVEAYERDRAAL